MLLVELDPQGNVYGISETAPPVGGYIFKFVPDRPADLSSGQLYALKIVSAAITASMTPVTSLFPCVFIVCDPPGHP